MIHHQNKLKKRLLRPVAIALIESRDVEDVVALLNKRLKMPRRLARPLGEYFRTLRMFQFMVDEELVLHRLCHRPTSLIARQSWQTHFQPIQESLIDWLMDREEKGKLPHLASPPPQMGRIGEQWPVPALTTLPALVAFLGLTLHQLEGLADLHGIQEQLPLGPRHHYRYRWVNSSHGKFRLLEIPKCRLKEVQRKILHGILDHVPPHACAHGFRAGHSIVTNATQHVQQEVVISFDLVDFSRP